MKDHKDICLFMPLDFSWGFIFAWRISCFRFALGKAARLLLACFYLHCSSIKTIKTEDTDIHRNTDLRQRSYRPISRFRVVCMCLWEWQKGCALIWICVRKCVWDVSSSMWTAAALLPPFPRCPQCLRVYTVFSFLLFPSPCLKHRYDSELCSVTGLFACLGSQAPIMRKHRSHMDSHGLEFWAVILLD